MCWGQEKKKCVIWKGLYLPLLGITGLSLRSTKADCPDYTYSYMITHIHTWPTQGAKGTLTFMGHKGEAMPICHMAMMIFIGCLPNNRVPLPTTWGHKFLRFAIPVAWKPLSATRRAHPKPLATVQGWTCDLLSQGSWMLGFLIGCTSCFLLLLNRIYTDPGVLASSWEHSGRAAWEWSQGGVPEASKTRRSYHIRPFGYMS